MDDFLKTLIEKEKEFRAKLEQTPLFKQWEGLKTTISVFENGSLTNGSEHSTSKGLVIPTVYSDDLSWSKKILFALGQLNAGFVSDIIAELRKNGVKESDEFMTKRISTTASSMKKKKILGSKSVGIKEKYFIKVKAPTV